MSDIVCNTADRCDDALSGVQLEKKVFLLRHTKELGYRPLCMSIATYVLSQYTLVYNLIII